MFHAGASANSASSTSPQTIPMPCRMRNNSPTMVPAVCVEPGREPKVTAATTGKKISAPIQTMSARKSSVRSRVFIWEEYKAGQHQGIGNREQGIGSNKRGFVGENQRCV